MMFVCFSVTAIRSRKRLQLFFSTVHISNSWTIYWFHISPCTIMFHISRHWAGTWEGVQYHNTQIGHLSAPPARHFRICYSMHKSVTEQDSNSCDHLTSLVIIILWSFDAWIGWKGAHYQPWPLVAMLHALFNTMPPHPPPYMQKVAEFLLCTICVFFTPCPRKKYGNLLKTASEMHEAFVYTGLNAQKWMLLYIQA